MRLILLVWPSVLPESSFIVFSNFTHIKVDDQSDMRNRMLLLSSSFFFSLEEKPVIGNDSVASERLLSYRLESVDEWSLEGDLNTRRTSARD